MGQVRWDERGGGRGGILGKEPKKGALLGEMDHGWGVEKEGEVVSIPDPTLS